MPDTQLSQDELRSDRQKTIFLVAAIVSILSSSLTIIVWAHGAWDQIRPFFQGIWICLAAVSPVVGLISVLYLSKVGRIAEWIIAVRSLPNKHIQDLSDIGEDLKFLSGFGDQEGILGRMAASLPEKYDPLTHMFPAVLLWFGQINLRVAFLKIGKNIRDAHALLLEMHAHLLCLHLAGRLLGPIISGLADDEADAQESARLQQCWTDFCERFNKTAAKLETCTTRLSSLRPMMKDTSLPRL
jgi:hypothetical protein